jgi:nucleoside-diphosphate-sugar epimerase
MSSLFILGVTGYIGGSVAVGYQAAFPSLTSISALVRSPADNAAVKAVGITPVQGTHADLDLITQEASKADIVLNAADADDLPLTRAVLKGIKQRYEKDPSKKPILIHTSGTGVVADLAPGELLPESEKIWNDNSEEDIRSIGEKQPHRNVDLEIFGAIEQGYVSAYIIAPSAIYGVGTGPKHRISQQVPGLVRLAIARKQVTYAGKGTNLWGNVHIKDLIDLYVLVLKLGLSGDQSAPYTRLYFGTSGEHACVDVAKAIAPILKRRGLVETDQTQSVQLSDYPFLQWVANNSRTKADRGFALGWKPTQPSIVDTLEEDIAAIVESK